MRTMVVTIAIIFSSFQAAAAQSTPPGNPSVIVVNGEAQIRVAPDEATVRLGIVRQARAAAQAQEQANAIAGEILTAIMQAGVAQGDIRTSGLRLSAMYEDRTQPPRISGYQASNVVTVRIPDLTKVGPVIDAGLKAGANEIQGVQFGIRDDLAARQQALRQAVTEARKKAEAIAEAANVQIIGILEINESGVSLMSKADYTGEVMMARSMAAPMPPTPVSAGDLEIHASVTIRYQIGIKR